MGTVRIRLLARLRVILFGHDRPSLYSQISIAGDIYAYNKSAQYAPKFPAYNTLTLFQAYTSLPPDPSSMLSDTKNTPSDSSPP
jgi:hypothetical protein